MLLIAISDCLIDGELPSEVVPMIFHLNDHEKLRTVLTSLLVKWNGITENVIEDELQLLVPHHKVKVIKGIRKEKSSRKEELKNIILLKYLM